MVCCEPVPNTTVYSSTIPHPCFSVLPNVAAGRRMRSVTSKQTVMVHGSGATVLQNRLRPISFYSKRQRCHQVIISFDNAAYTRGRQRKNSLLCMRQKETDCTVCLKFLQYGYSRSAGHVHDIGAVWHCERRPRQRPTSALHFYLLLLVGSLQ